jgi:hypothetical protein
MSDVLTHFKVTEKALLVQAVAFNEWSLLMIDQMITEREASLVNVKEAVVDDGLERMLVYLEGREEKSGTAAAKPENGGEGDDTKPEQE